jgi:hypothetical protein
MSKKLCNLFGGRLWAENDGHSGFSFHFTIHADGMLLISIFISVSFHTCAHSFCSLLLLLSIALVCKNETQLSDASTCLADKTLLVFLSNQTNAQILQDILTRAGASVCDAFTRCCACIRLSSRSAGF